MPIWAPRAGIAGLVTKGHSTGAWSEVIRHTDTGADAGAQPRPRCRTPRRGVGGKNRASLTGGAGGYVVEFARYAPVPPAIQQQLASRFQLREDDE